MKKKNKAVPVIVLSVLVLLLLGVITLRIISGITKKNPEGTLGNTAGNIYNLGLFCERDGYIYFANPGDDGTLYRMTTSCTDLKKVYDDKIRYINADGNYIYYCRTNNLKSDGGSVFSVYNTGLYRINAKGSASLKALSTNPVAALVLCGNTVYYQKYFSNEGLVFYSIGTDGKNEYRIASENIFPGCVYEGKMYYSGMLEDRNIWSMDLKTGTKELVYEGMSYFPIATTRGVFFMDVGDYRVYCLQSNGEKKKIVDKMVCTYNITPDERYLFYQTDRYDTNHIGVVDLRTGSDTSILDGDFKYINVTSNYVFFTTFDETTTYAYSLDGTGQINLFVPGKLK